MAIFMLIVDHVLCLIFIMVDAIIQLILILMLQLLFIFLLLILEEIKLFHLLVELLIRFKGSVDQWLILTILSKDVALMLLNICVKVILKVSRLKFLGLAMLLLILEVLVEIL